MAFCAHCGSTLVEAGAPCNACGAAASSASAAQPQYATVGANAATAAPAADAPISNNVAAMLSYLLAPLSAIVLLVMEPYKNDRFVRFHSFQSIFFCLGWIALWIAMGILSMILGTLTGGLFALISLPIYLILGLAGMAYWIFLMVKAYSGQMHLVPVVGRLAEQQANK
jgi:uncharacterized membrane protein